MKGLWWWSSSSTSWRSSPKTRESVQSQTHASHQLESLFALFLSHLHLKEPESCAGTSPPYHLCTISSGTPSAQPRWMWCSLSFLLTSQLHCGNHRPCWVKRGGNPEFDLFRTVVATLSSSNTRGHSTRSVLMETTDWREGVHHEVVSGTQWHRRTSFSLASKLYESPDALFHEYGPRFVWNCSKAKMM